MTGPVEVATVPVEPIGGRPLAAATAVATIAVPVVLVVLGGIERAVATIIGDALVLAGTAAVLLAHRALVVRARRRDHSTTVRAFRVTPVAGPAVDVTLAGELHGGRIDRGDVVDVFGRPGRAGGRAREVVVTARGERVTGHRSAAEHLVRGAVVLPAVCTGFAACSLAFSLLVR